MSPWTALLESLHSALIDELNERLPDHKPELGMPMRQRELAFPSPELPSALIVEVTFAVEGGEARGFALLGCDPACGKKLGLGSRSAWDALIKRAGREFLFRKIQPKLGNPVEIRPPGALPAGFAVPGRVVWIPFRLNPGTCYLGVGA